MAEHKLRLALETGLKEEVTQGSGRIGLGNRHVCERGIVKEKGIMEKSATPFKIPGPGESKTGMVKIVTG